MSKGRDMPFGDNNQVGGCQRINVRKGNDFFILIKDLARYLASYNLAENAIHSFVFPPSSVLFIYLTPLIPLSFKGEGEILFWKGFRPFPLLLWARALQPKP